MNRTERMELLKNLIENVEIKRQEDIVEILAERGYKITQATISRDIKDLGLVKVGGKDGSFRYMRPDNIRGDLNVVLEKSVNHVRKQGIMIRLDVVPGTSMGVKNMLRIRHQKEIFAIMTDDDTVLIYARNTKVAEELYEQLNK